MCWRVPECLFVYVRVCVRTCVFMCVRPYVWTYVFVFMGMWMCVRACVLVRVCVTHAHTHRHTQKRTLTHAVAGCIGVEYTHIKEGILARIPETSSVLVEASLKDSPDSGCKCGSMTTLGQTSVSREAVRSLISLWRIVGKPPM